MLFLVAKCYQHGHFGLELVFSRMVINCCLITHWELYLGACASFVSAKEHCVPLCDVWNILMRFLIGC